VTLFVTHEEHVGTVYYPEPLIAVRPGDVLVGLFGRNCPFILRLLANEAGGEQWDTMVNLAYVVSHKYEHPFVEKAGPKAKWRDFEKFGLREYTII
jgi:hypothetical protein